jgi:CDP-diacylglycerol---serine O-phosphatidyltransferase
MGQEWVKNVRSFHFSVKSVGDEARLPVYCWIMSDKSTSDDHLDTKPNSADSDQRAVSEARFQTIPLRHLIPNCITLLSLCSGLTAVRFGFEGRFDAAVVAIALAALLDALDGRVARMLKGASRFGAELDSLADFICFGCAPALILYAWLLKDLKSFGWMAVLAVAIAAALRLARFNVMLDDPDKPEWQKKFFVGMPAPAGALCALLPLYLHLSGVPEFRGQSVLIAVYLLGIAFLMVSRLPTLAGKNLGLRIQKRYVLALMVAVAMLGYLAVVHTFETLAGLAIIYLVSLPLGLRYAGQLAQQHKANQLARR